jgi:DNA-binding Lrp family transcriptional regulator
MEQALILAILDPSFKNDKMEEIKKIPGVENAHMIYGPYDLYVMVKTKDIIDMRNAVMRIREVDGIKSTVTCNVIPPI